jgi:hypothetical protein
MDRYVNTDVSNFQAGVVGVDLIFTAAAAGAVPAVLYKADGVASVVLQNTNDYLVTLQDAYIDFLNAEINVQQATYNASTGAVYGNVVAHTIDTTGTLTIHFYNAAGAIVNLASGDQLRVTFRLQRWTTN